MKRLQLLEQRLNEIDTGHLTVRVRGELDAELSLLMRNRSLYKGLQQL